MEQQQDRVVWWWNCKERGRHAVQVRGGGWCHESFSVWFTQTEKKLDKGFYWTFSMFRPGAAVFGFGSGGALHVEAVHRLGGVACGGGGVAVARVRWLRSHWRSGGCSQHQLLAWKHKDCSKTLQGNTKFDLLELFCLKSLLIQSQF